MTRKDSSKKDHHKMTHKIKTKYLLLATALCFSTTASAFDTYIASEGNLYLPHVKVGELTYQVVMQNQGNYVFRVTSTKLVGGVSTTTDSYNSATNILNIPDVSLGTQNYKVVMTNQGDLTFNLSLATPVDTTLNQFSTRAVASNLGLPYDLNYGPDNHLWLTSRTGTVSRIDPTTGGKQILLTLPDVYLSSGQDGLLGMALHPSLLNNTDQNHVFLAYTYSTNGAESGLKLKIVRYNYDQNTHQLNSPVTLMSNLPGSRDHNGGRLIWGDDNKLYYTIGDQGANQFASKCNEIMSQTLPTASEVSSHNWNSYQGKILRINLDGSIPADNPVLNGVKSHIYSYGFRNPQGLIFANDTLYSSEHGPKTDDEINIVTAGKDYGWPYSAGFIDDRAYEYCNWSTATNCSSLTFSNYSCPVASQPESSGNLSNFAAPLQTFYTVDFGFDFQNPPGRCTSPFICWPSIAPSSIEHYNPKTSSIPGWNNSLLMTSLKKGEIYRVKMDGSSTLLGDTSSSSYTQNRYRDIVVHPTEKKFFVVTDASGQTTASSGGSTTILANPATILEFSYIE